MFSKFRNFISRHKRKFIFTGVVFAAGGVALHYARKKLLEFQESQAKEFMEKTRRIQHFESTERTCNQAIHNLYSSVLEAVAKLYNTKIILQELRERAKELTTTQKIDLWDQLLTKSFTRIVTLVYSLTLLVISLRVQVNILAGYIYKEIDKVEKNCSQDIQNNYLSFIQHFIKDGIRDLALIIRNNTERVLRKYDLKQQLTLAELEQIFWSIQMAVNYEIEHSEEKNLAKILLPPEDPQGNEFLQKMLSEAVDMLETDEVFSIVTHHVGLGFSAITDEVANFFSSTTTKTLNNNVEILNEAKDSSASLLNISQVKVALAKLIPIIDGLVPQTVNEKPFTTNVLNFLINSDKIKMLGANTYEVFCQ
uniref:Peroxisomal biogenesis factor 3 n=1 Tax=Culicoides sonorensis TaxID=179676 RepID=A0A336N0L8_CULSO